MECPDDKYSKLKIFVSELNVYSYNTNTSLCINAINYLTLITVTCPRFVGTVPLLIRYSKDHAK
jgi:hypothetical protein